MNWGSDSNRGIKKSNGEIKAKTHLPFAVCHLKFEIALGFSKWQGLLPRARYPPVEGARHLRAQGDKE
jgi:hypothetical protein